jgi:SAM-dependent methyltransferase
MKMYADFAEWWPLISHPDEYEEESAVYAHHLRRVGGQPAATLLELGGGGGNNAFFLKRSFLMTLTDVSEPILAVSRALNPECEHLQGDMRDLRLGRQFDRVFIHDAIAYMTSRDDLRRALDTAFVHCRPGGGAVIAPDFVRETLRCETECGGNDADGRAARYLEWAWDPDPSDETYIADYILTLRERDGSVRVEHDRHIEGVFARKTWLSLLSDVGFDAECVSVDLGLDWGDSEIFVATRRQAL